MRSVQLLSVSIVACALCVLLSMPKLIYGSSQEDAIWTLKKKIAELEGRVKRLESYHERTGSSSVQQRSYSNGYKNLSNWRGLKKGMSEENVRVILGEPKKINMYSTWSSWKYANGGDVDFDRNGEVTAWSEP